MTDGKPDSPAAPRGQRSSHVKKASAASVGATLLLVVGYLLASWLGIPLDALTTLTPDGPPATTQQPTAQQPTAQQPTAQRSTAQRPTAQRPSPGSSGAAVRNTSDTRVAVDRPSAVAEGAARTKNAAQPSAGSSFRIENVTIRNLDGKVAFRGTVDLTATMRRIDEGRQLTQFRNDGSNFQNRERRLPKKETGYYTEYVHPTPRLGGPGPQRVVTGKQGEAYYTSDHYKTFQRIR